MPAWESATKDEKQNYTAKLHDRLQSVKCPGSMLHCRDSKCSDSVHSKDRDKAMLDILLGIVETSYTTLPLTGKVPGPPENKDKDRDIIPGWSSEVEPLRLQSNYCYRAWLASGKPSQGETPEAKLRSHAQFCHAVRRVKRASKLHQAQGLFEAAMAGDIELIKEM